MKNVLTSRDALPILTELFELSPSEIADFERVLKTVPFHRLVQMNSSEVQRFRISSDIFRKLKLLEKLFHIHLQSAQRRSYVRFNNPKAVWNYFAPFLAPLPYEEIWLALVDAKLQLDLAIPLSQGTSNSAPLAIDTVIQTVQDRHGLMFFIIHNHPSGDPTPSPEDIIWTENLKCAAEEEELIFVDHVIIGKFHPFEDETVSELHPPYYSFAKSWS